MPEQVGSVPLTGRFGACHARAVREQPSQLFMPGSGQLPPYLAGREAEQALLQRYLEVLRGSGTVPCDIVLSGPRGNGKTALLRWFERRIEAAEPPVDVVWLTPDAIRDLDGLATELAPPGRFESLLPDTANLSIGFGSAGWQLHGRSASLTRLLASRCKRRPLALLLDEAQNLDEALGRALLNSSQSVRARAPFLLVLAGTPNLESCLNAMGATFWDRAEHLGIGRLDAEASADALVKPIEGQGSSVSPEALERVVAESQHYPYFIQIWGESLWSKTWESRTRLIDAALVADARPRFESRKAKYYGNRHVELSESGLLPAAAAVAGAFRGGTLTDAELRRAIDEVRSETRFDDSGAAALRLRELGYIWRPPGQIDWEPGIPSLMRFIQDATEKR